MDDRQCVVYSYSGILLSDKKERTIDSETGMNLKNIMFMKNAGYKKCLLYNPIYMKF